MELGLKNSALLRNIIKRFNDPSQLRWIMMGLVLCTGVIGVYMPLSGRADDAERKANHEKERLALIKDLEHLREDYKNVKQHIVKMDPSDWATYLNEGTRLFKGLRVLSLETQSTRSMPPYRLAVLAIVLEGTYPLFDQYLHWLDTNER